LAPCRGDGLRGAPAERVVLDGLPNSLRNHGSIASNTSGAIGVVAL